MPQIGVQGRDLRKKHLAKREFPACVQLTYIYYRQVCALKADLRQKKTRILHLGLVFFREMITVGKCLT